MASTTVRVSRQTHTVLGELAKESGLSIQEVLAQAVEAYRRQQWLAAANAEYAALRANPDAWAEEEAERRLWDATLMDGLEGDPWSDE